MAKELPFFKFEPNQWDNGNIQMLPRELKGLFIDLCSSYWSRLGELPYALALQKHCNGNAKPLEVLIQSEIIGMIDGQIIIEFLDEQLDEFQETSTKRRNAANKRWKKANNASALQLQSKSNAIRGEEIRKEEIRKDNNTCVEKISNDLESLDEIFLDKIKGLYREVDFNLELERFKAKVISNAGEYFNHGGSGLRLAFQAHLKTAPKTNKILTKKLHDLT